MAFYHATAGETATARQAGATHIEDAVPLDKSAASVLRVGSRGAKIFSMKIALALLAAFVAATSFSAQLIFLRGSWNAFGGGLHGGCTASAQAHVGGRSMLRVWSFENGAQDGVELKGLQIAALQVAERTSLSLIHSRLRRWCTCRESD